MVGNLGADPEGRRTQDGRPVATSETWRDKATGKRREKTEWRRPRAPRETGGKSQGTRTTPVVAVVAAAEYLGLEVTNRPAIRGLWRASLPSLSAESR